MYLSFYGAAREVTGSCYCIEINRKKILVDCGLQQGLDEKDNQELPFDAKEIDAVVLTHAHIDHSGRLPLLVREGFKGRIYSILATCRLVSIMLRDSANIQENDAEWENKQLKKTNTFKKIKPLYTQADAVETIRRLVPCNYEKTYKITPEVSVNFVDSGHILGSASVEIFLEEGPLKRKLVFSGDIGNIDQPIIKDPQYIKQADYVVMEATYGDRLHERSHDFTADLAKIIDETLNRKGNVIIPAFAVARTQSVLYMLREIKERKLVKKTDFKVYVDSPLAAEATDLYDDDLILYADEQTREIMKKGFNPISFPGLHFTASVQESKALNYDKTPKVIISSSGMCEAGRIRHHLKNNLGRSECSIIFVGFQAQGTLGRLLIDGAKSVMIFDEEIPVLARIYDYSGLSAHADKNGLLNWVRCFEKKPDIVFIVHVDKDVFKGFIEELEREGFNATAPLYKSTYDLSDGRIISEGIEV